MEIAQDQGFKAGRGGGKSLLQALGPFLPHELIPPMSPGKDLE